MPTLSNPFWRLNLKPLIRRVPAQVQHHAECLPRPGAAWGGYPMRAAPQRPASEWQAWWAQWRRHAQPAPPARREALIQSAQVHAAALRVLDSAGFAQQAVRARLSLVRHGLGVAQLNHLAHPMAVVAEAIRRETGLEVRPAQWHAAVLMLGNALVELPTGEGKSVVSVLCAATAALAGVPVHVLTANDYLAARDARTWQSVYALLGLSAGVIQAGDEPDVRRAMYALDVVHASARELAFDHLRDRQGALPDGGAAGHEQPVLRGLCMAVIDEADSALIDEATVPMILSKQVPDGDVKRHRVALFLARQMQADVHAVEHLPGVWQLTEVGRDWLQARAQSLGPDWQLRRLREDTVMLALAALRTYVRDVHYVVHDDEVQIVDACTGRRSQGRQWSRGLHQLIAIKEGLMPAPLTTTLQQLSYQQIFPRYVRLCGLSATLRESRRELMRVYGLPVVCVAPHRPSQRVERGVRVCRDDTTLWQGVAQRVRTLHEQGLPVLVGTRSVAESDTVANALKTCGLSPRVLNARDDADEEGIVAQAGQFGAITVATQMAGRGTDISVPEAVAEQGGLQVISVGLPLSARVSRQLAGRAGRQGQRGGHEQWLSLQDEAWSKAPHWARWMRRVWPASWAWGWQHGLVALQKRQAQRDASSRWRTLVAEEQQATQMAWSGQHPWDR